MRLSQAVLLCVGPLVCFPFASMGHGHYTVLPTTLVLYFRSIFLICGLLSVCFLCCCGGDFSLFASFFLFLLVVSSMFFVLSRFLPFCYDALLSCGAFVRVAVSFISWCHSCFTFGAFRASPFICFAPAPQRRGRRDGSGSHLWRHPGGLPHRGGLRRSHALGVHRSAQLVSGGVTLALACCTEVGSVTCKGLLVETPCVFNSTRTCVAWTAAH